MRQLGFRVGAVWCAAAVALGAFGAHLLRAKLPPDQLQTFETAVRYQFYAGLGIQLAALARARSATLLLMIGGSAVFSGTLYLYLATGVRWLGAITPLGGLSLIASWLLLARDGWSVEDDHL